MPVRLGVQLYTLRQEARRNGLGSVIDRLGHVGFEGVELAELHELSPAEAQQRIADAGMTIASSHVRLPEPEAATRVLDEHAALGCNAIVVAFLPPADVADENAVRSAADRLNAFNESVRARGSTLGLHNHWWEFSTRLGERSAHAFLFSLLDSDVFAEVDTYWAQVGGADPVRVVERLGPRARLLHIKDGPADAPESTMTPVGEGVVDVRGIVAASNASWHIVELDRYEGDMFEAVEKSYRFMKRIAGGG